MIESLTQLHEYTDTNGDTWHIYVALTNESNYIEYWVQKHNYGIMDLCFGVDRIDDDYTRQVEQFIENIKDEERFM